MYAGVKSELYKRLEVPTVVYRVETSGLRLHDRHDLEVFEIKFLRSLC